jgi:hypothetical protein
VREETLLVPAHPEYVNGCEVWVKGGSVGDIVNRVQNGDPTKGWEGDPRMVVLFNKDALDERGVQVGQWILARLGFDGKYHVIAANTPGAPLGLDLIDNLVKYDSRRGYNAAAEIDKHNAAVQKEKDEAFAGKMAERYSRLAFEAKKAGLID